MADKRARGRQQGGKTRSKRTAVIPVDTPDVTVKDIGGVVTLIAMSINEVRKGVTDPIPSTTALRLSLILLAS